MNDRIAGVAALGDARIDRNLPQEWHAGICGQFLSAAVPENFVALAVIPDKKAAQHQLVRIIDESDEDYLFDESWFVPIKLPPAAKEAMLAAA